MENFRDSNIKEWFPHRIISGEDPIALLILNQPLNEESIEYLKSVWNSAAFHVAVDGGANELKNISKSHANQPELIPDLICGDFDSALPEILDYYRKKNVTVIHTPDQDETDFTKALRLTVKNIQEKGLQVSSIVALVRNGDRLDHILGNLNTLFMATEFTSLPITILGHGSLTWLLSTGSHKIHVTDEMMSSHVGLVPLGEECTNVTTTGLKWNLTKTQKMKHGITKGDKKKKKEVTAEIAQLLADLELKHEEQLKQYEGHNAANQDTPDDNCINQSIDDTNDCSKDAAETVSEENEIAASNASAKVSKAQKRRNKKAQQQKDREKAIADQEEKNLLGLRHIESLKIKEILSGRGLTIVEIPSDGNCLYQAIVHQLLIFNLEKKTVSSLREETSRYLQMHKEEFVPFLIHPGTGDILTDVQFEKYCDDIVNTPAWGGHVEIKILSSICGRPIEVIQADGPSVIVGEENPEPKLIISYHRHVYGLGEHYNSVVPADKLPDTATDI